MDVTEAHRSTARVRRLVRALSWVVTACGVALLAWGFATWKWGDPVTALYTHWEQRKLADAYERYVEAYEPPPVKPTTPPRVRAAQIRRAAKRLRTGLDDGDPLGRIKVDRLGLDMVMVNGTDASSLRKGPGRDPRTFLPGEGELVYIAGHRTTFAAPFAHIERLKAGDRVVLDVPYGRFVYSVTKSVIVPADDLDRLESRGREEVALQACHPRFSASERYIVYAVPTDPTSTGSQAAGG
jgi:sortase A